MAKQLKGIKELNEMHILYVEDDEIIAKAFIMMLERMVKKVEHCKNGQEGYESYLDHHPDIIITDIKMPIMSGLEMSELIRQEDDDIPIIIVSAYNETEFLKDAFEVGITYYLNKPINRLVLMRTLNESAKSVVYRRQQAELIINYEETIDAFVDLIERRDRYTAGHSTRVAHYCRLIAKGMQLGKNDTSLLEKAAKLHDIGKIEIPDSILLSPNKMNDLEYAIIKEHLDSGYNVLSKIQQYKDLAEIMRHHHERYDGSGYPQGIKEAEIPLLSHIMIVADAFDAMTSKRIYKPQMSIGEALLEIEMLSAKQFHPDVAKVAFEVLKDIKVQLHSDQMPQSTLEEKKFSYFFSDPLTGLYNETYLKSLLKRKGYEESGIASVGYVTVVDLCRLSAYNSAYGWERGNALLKRIALYLLDAFSDALIFRVRGDQFFLLLKDRREISDAALDGLIDDKSVSFKIREFSFDEFLTQNCFHD